MDDLYQTAQDIGDMLKKIEGTTDVMTGLEESSEEIRIVVNKNEAMKYGLTVAGICSTLSQALKTETTSTT